jgi:hypothetical protein
MQPTSSSPRTALFADLRAELSRCDDFLLSSDPMDLDHRYLIGVQGGTRVLREAPQGDHLTLVGFRVFGPRRDFSYREAVELRASMNARRPASEPRLDVFSFRDALEAHRENLSLAIDALEKLAA